jgi:hypothetical protein
MRYGIKSYVRIWAKVVDAILAEREEWETLALDKQTSLDDSWLLIKEQQERIDELEDQLKAEGLVHLEAVAELEAAETSLGLSRRAEEPAHLKQAPTPLVVAQIVYGEPGRDPRDGPRLISWNELRPGTYALCLAPKALDKAPISDEEYDLLQALHEMKDV